MMLVSLDSTMTKFIASPFCADSLSLLFPLFIYFIGLCIGTYSFYGRNMDIDLLREKEVVPSEKHIDTSNLWFLA